MNSKDFQKYVRDLYKIKYRFVLNGRQRSRYYPQFKQEIISKGYTYNLQTKDFIFKVQPNYFLGLLITVNMTDEINPGVTHQHEVTLLKLNLDGDDITEEVTLNDYENWYNEKYQQKRI